MHPGYGFLSEKHFFAEAVAQAGATFIGPPVSALVSMGDKITSKNIAKKAGVRARALATALPRSLSPTFSPQVSTVPGHNAPIVEESEVVRIANEIGYPVMVKASGGGGGKGMRVAYSTSAPDGPFLT